MQVDITKVLEKINETTKLVQAMDAQDVTTSDMKSMNHFKKYTDGILAHVKANPNIDTTLLDVIKVTLLEYRDAINEKHGEAQGKSDFIAAKADDINTQYNDLLEVEGAIQKAKELESQSNSLESSKNVLAENQSISPHNNMLPPDGWQQAEMTLTEGALKLVGFCIKVAVALPMHTTAAVIGAGAGIIANSHNTIGNAFSQHTSNVRHSMVDISTDDFVTKQKESNNIQAGTRLLECLRNISTAGVALSSEKLNVIRNKTTGVLSTAKELTSTAVDLASKGGSELREILGLELEKAKKVYEESCIALSVKSKEKLSAVNDDLKKISEGLASTISAKVGSFSHTIKQWVSNITSTLSKVASNIKMAFQPQKAQSVAEGDVVVSM